MRTRRRRRPPPAARRPRRRGAALLLAPLLLAGALASCATTSHPTTTGATLPTTPWGATAAEACDPIAQVPGQHTCMVPFPDDWFTVADSASRTGRRVEIPTSAMPAGLSPAPYDGNDGFSPGSSVIVAVPGLDLAASRVATISDMAAWNAPSPPVVLLDTTTGTRWPYWAELDAHQPASDPPLLLVHPQRDFAEGDHYVAVLRDLRTAAGAAVPAFAGFQRLLDQARGPAAATSPHAAHLAGLLAEATADGVPTTGADLVWDFTIASEHDITAPALAMRDQAMAWLARTGDTAFTVTSVTNDPAKNPDVARDIGGTFEVPDFLSTPGVTPGSVLHTGADGLPAPDGDNLVQARFACEIPKAADADPADPQSPVHPAHVGLYGHGLFGNATEVDESGIPGFSDTYDFSFCSTDWLGLSSDNGDPAFALSVVENLNRFPSLVDHLMQAIVDMQVLGRLLDRPDGFAANRAFQDAAGKALIDPSSGLVYDGNSEGGIMGGAVVALSSDVRRAVLGVPGMDYDLLIPRSADFAEFLIPLDVSVPEQVDQAIGFDLVQMLWDRGETDGYVEQLASHFLPGAAPHRVLLAEAFGDHQVANITTETEARTIGAGIHTPALAPGRSNEADPFYGLAALPDTPTPGPALYVWDSGVPAPPLTDSPPTAGPDPHDTVPRTDPTFWRQMAGFFSTGLVPDVCGSAPCTAPYPG